MGQGGSLPIMYSPGVWKEKQISAELPVQPSLQRLEGSVRHSLILGPPQGNVSLTTFMDIRVTVGYGLHKTDQFTPLPAALKIYYIFFP
jgi:hypothetical protein